jgi:hypothetical protein
VTGRKDEVIGSTDIAGLAGSILKLTLLLDMDIHASQNMIIWVIVIEEQMNMSVRSFLWVYRSRKSERNR